MIRLFSQIPLKINTIAKHLLFIGAYYLYEIGMLYAYTGEGVYFWDASIHLIVNLCFFYFNAHVVLMYSTNRPGKLKAFFCTVLLVGLEFLFFLAAKYLVNRSLPELGIPTSRPFQNWETFIRDVSWRFFYLLGLSTAYWLALSSAAKQRRLASLEHTRLRELAQQEIVKQDLLHTENAFLKAQINSHFLFNTLNYLHASVHDLNPKVGQTVLDLASILRYSFNSNAEGKVRLAEELKHISHIFNITRIKSSKPMHLDFSVEGSAGDFKIIPLILVTLAENMLKYADFYDPTHHAKFSCHISGNALTIEISDAKCKSQSSISSGIGMDNLQRRLNLAYDDAYLLFIDDSETNYVLKLIIPLNHAL